MRGRGVCGQGFGWPQKFLPVPFSLPVRALVALYRRLRLSQGACLVADYADARLFIVPPVRGFSKRKQDCKVLGLRNDDLSFVKPLGLAFARCGVRSLSLSLSRLSL